MPEVRDRIEVTRSRVRQLTDWYLHDKHSQSARLNLQVILEGLIFKQHQLEEAIRDPELATAEYTLHPRRDDIILNFPNQEISLIDAFKTYTDSDVTVHFTQLGPDKETLGGWLYDQLITDTSDERDVVMKVCNMHELTQLQTELEQKMGPIAWFLPDLTKNNEGADYTIILPPTFTRQRIGLAQISHELGHVATDAVSEELVAQERNAHARALRFLRYLEQTYDITTDALGNNYHLLPLMNYQTNYLIAQYASSAYLQQHPDYHQTLQNNASKFATVDPHDKQFV